MRYLLTANTSLIVKGPATVTIVSGNSSVFGAPLSPNMELIIHRQKQLPIEATADSELEIAIGRFGRISEIEGSLNPDDGARCPPY